MKNSPDTLKEILLVANKYNKIALQVAAAKGYLAIVNALLESVKNDYTTLNEVLLANDANRTALHLAAENGCLDVVNIILESIRNYPAILEEIRTMAGDYKITISNSASQLSITM